jgi:hypothetical protein
MLSGCSIGAWQLAELLMPLSSLFCNIQELKIIDRSRREFPNFIGLYKNCKNVRRLTVESNEGTLSELLREFLPLMTQLEELTLNCNEFEINERLQAVRESCFGLSRLWMKQEQVEMARVVFEGAGNLVIEGI